MALVVGDKVIDGGTPVMLVLDGFPLALPVPKQEPSDQSTQYDDTNNDTCSNRRLIWSARFHDFSRINYLLRGFIRRVDENSTGDSYDR